MEAKKRKGLKIAQKTLKNHKKKFSPDFSRLQGWGGWVRPNLENSRFYLFFFEPFPNPKVKNETNMQF